MATMTKTEELKALCASKGVKYVGTRGNTKSPVWFIGEAPGADEEREGFPFVGSSGKELERMSIDAGLGVGNCCFTNPYKYRPPSNDITLRGTCGIPDELSYAQFFEELYENKPTFIVACGATPLGILCPQTLSRKDQVAKISQWRGSLLTSPRLGWPHYVIPMFHPAFVLREWSERQISVFCLARVQEELAYWERNGRIQELPQRELIIAGSADDTISFLHECLASPGPVSNDIEMIGGRVPYTISVAISPERAISFGFWEFETDKSIIIWRLLDRVLREKVTIGQNYTGFDCRWLETLGFRPCISKVHDTMVSHHVLYPEFEHKLQFQTFQYTREPYYKDEGKYWKPKEGLRPLKLYNAKDSAVTYEIWERQQEELDERGLRHFYDYEMRLAQRFYYVEARGIRVDPDKLKTLRDYVEAELLKATAAMSGMIARPVASSKDDAETRFAGIKDVFNLNSVPQLKTVLDSMNLKLPVDRRTGNTSTGEEQLNLLFAKTGHPFLKEVLRVRELNKIKGTYIEAKLANNTLLTNYVTTGTVTGRRSSRTNVFGYGTNLQNQPKHSDLGKRFLDCIVARPGKIFVSCDQVQAEDWIVQGIIADVSGRDKGLRELLGGVDRHRKLASFLFTKPEHECGKDTPERFMGKKTRHAGNYDMEAFRFTQAMAQEGYIVPQSHCEYLLAKFHQFDPDIKGVFHTFVQEQLTKYRKLVTPFGRERYFYSLRPFSDNKKIFKEGYSYIPQSTVGDNTGMAIDWLEENWFGYVLLDSHDAVTVEVDDDLEAVRQAIKMQVQAFNRIITFPNGLSLQIPIEAEIGYSLSKMKKVCEIRYHEGAANCLDNLLDPGLTSTYNSLRPLPNPLLTSSSGAQLQSLVRP